MWCNGISAEPFTELESVAQHELRARFGLPQDAFLVGSFSRLACWKGQHILLEALLEAPEMHAVLGLWVSALTPTRRNCVPTCSNTASLTACISLVQHDIAACMTAVDVVAHTSISPEPFGRVIIEGMLAKRPIVAARAGGVTDIVEDRENGILCTPGDVHALAGALGELSADVGLRNRLVEQGYANEINRFGTERYVESVQKILSDVARKSRSKRG